jgi:arsenite methyltransferase
MEEKNSIKEQVRERYAREAERVLQKSGKALCCGTAGSSCDPITSNLYQDDEKSALPADAVAVSLGCGNPTALAELRQGETVLDLGSGGGIDVFLSARRVGPTAKHMGSI